MSRNSRGTAAASRRRAGTLAIALATASALGLPLAGATAATAATPSHARTSAIVRPATPRAATGLVFTVNTTTDENDVTPLSGPCAGADGKCSLRAAMEIGDARQVPITIRVPAGHFVLGFTLENYDAGGMTIIGAGQGKTVISGANTWVPFFVADQATIAVGPSVKGVAMWLSGVTVEQGLSFSSGNWNGEGGCFVVASPNDYLSVASSTITQCTSSFAGGAIWSLGDTNLSGDTFLQNSSVEYGAAVSSGQTAFGPGGSGFLTATGTTFRFNVLDNTTSTAYGAAIYARGPAMLRGSTFYGNATTGTTAEGGAAYLDAAAQLVGDTFSYNHAYPFNSVDNTYGGALYLNGPTKVLGSSFSNNTVGGATGEGGAIYNDGQLSLDASKLTANVAVGSTDGYGGAVYNNAALESAGTSFKANAAQSPAFSAGGAVYDNGAGATLTAASFTANKALNGAGGAFYDNGGGDTVTGSTFSGNLVTGGTPSVPDGPGFGGAFSANDSAYLVANRFVGNHAAMAGGALWTNSAVISTGETFFKNSAEAGGAVFNYWQYAATGDALIDNTASFDGGAIFNVGYTGTQYAHEFTLTDTVVAGNAAPVGGGIFFQGGTSASAGSAVQNSVIAGNKSTSGAESECFYDATTPITLPPVSLGGNVTGDASCAIASPTDRPGSARQGYWFAAASGAVHGVNAPVVGHSGGPVTAMAAAPGNAGYWEVTAAGVVHGSGTAVTLGSAVGKLHGGTATGIAGTPDGLGYWVTSSTGAVVAIGDAQGFGQALGQHVIGIARSVDGGGYELLLASGKVLGFGDAPHLGSAATGTAASIAMTPDGQGYWEVTKTGHVAAYGDAKGYGSATASGVIGIFSAPNGRGYLIVTSHGKVFARGSAHAAGAASGTFSAAAAT